MANDEEKVVATEAEAETKAKQPAAKKAAEKIEKNQAEDKKETKAEAADTTEPKVEVVAETKEEVAVEQVEKAVPQAAVPTASTTPRPERSYGGENRGYGDRRGGPRQRRRKVCQFCVDRQDFIDYKDSGKLRKFISERAKIIPRRVTGTCARHQRELTTAIKKARQVALLPYVSD